jgi:hypothetical protein
MWYRFFLMECSSVSFKADGAMGMSLSAYPEIISNNPRRRQGEKTYSIYKAANGPVKMVPW